MKKVFIVLFLVLSCTLFAQNVEIAASFPFGKPFGYWTGWDPNDGVSPSFDIKFITEKNEFIFFSVEEGVFYTLKLDGSVTKNFSIENYNRYNTDIFYSSFYNGYIIGFNNNLGNRNEINAKCKIMDAEKIIYREDGGSMRDAYLTGNTLFWGNLASIEFLTDGNYKIRNVDETKVWLESGKGEELGWSQEFYKGEVISDYLGDIDISNVSKGYKIDVQSNLKPMTKKYQGITKMKKTGYRVIGKDRKGLLYYRDFPSGNDNTNIQFAIAVLDPFTHEVYFYEDYESGLWTPPLDSEGNFIGSYSWSVAPDGNIYFTDADVEKGEYQIKRIVNRWWEEMGINKRIIGQMNTNHIPLMKTQTGTENDGYCFENDFVWVKEQSADKKWSKIQKIDGRIGWIETKYININTMVPLTNGKTVSTAKTASETRNGITIGRIMKATDNLRLRKTELTSSEIITSMLKGTAVKIISFGREETIDGIKSSWVQVEVQSGGKDRDGKSIPEGTRGWCFGGYLK